MGLFQDENKFLNYCYFFAMLVYSHLPDKLRLNFTFFEFKCYVIKEISIQTHSR